MKFFVESQLSASPGFGALRDLDTAKATELIENITTKASGVFLWTRLVAMSLLEGLAEGERLRELQNRLDSLLADLEKLFWNILKSLGPWHHSCFKSERLLSYR
jgi:hypothetical protein